MAILAYMRDDCRARLGCNLYPETIGEVAAIRNRIIHTHVIGQQIGRKLRK